MGCIFGRSCVRKILLCLSNGSLPISFRLIDWLVIGLVRVGDERAKARVIERERVRHYSSIRNVKLDVIARQVPPKGMYVHVFLHDFPYQDRLLMRAEQRMSNAN